MADTPETDKLVKKEPAAAPAPEAPAHDPITSRTTSSILLISALLLTGSLAWALWDEVYGQRPWKDTQASFVKRYNRYLKRLQRSGFQSEQEVRDSQEYKDLNQGALAAEELVKPELQVIDRKVALIDDQLAVISDEFQDRRGRITVKNYQIESADADDKSGMRRELQEMKAQKARFEMPSESGRSEQKEYDYAQLEGLYNDLKREKAALLTERGEKLKPVSDLRRQRDEYLKNNVAGVTEDQVNKLLAKNENFEVKMRQINIQGDQVVDRCETCHLGTREPIEIDAGDMMSAGRRNRPDQMARAFVSHPSKELLQIHDPEKFGCASCHGGNGRATTSIEKGHGRHRFWLHPLYERENMEAGCQQCHMQDRVLVGSPILNKGKDLFTERGCVGCHRYEGFDRETDSLAAARQEIKQLEEQVAANNREALSAQAKRDESGISDEENQRLLAQIESLTVTSSQIEARVDQLNIQSRYLMQDQKKVGPNLKDVRIKLVKEWIPEWLKDPQAFRPGTKMPTYWYLSGEQKGVGNIVPPARQDEERKAIAAYLWQSAFDGRLPQQPTGNAATGKQLFETRGCLACHSIGEGESAIGAEFAANLQKVGQKANYEYLVRWVHNPRERTSPYCPKERKDLTPADYAAKNLPYVFDANHSKCPNDGAELQIQNMTVMPNFRLSDQDSRDIATYLKSLSPPATYPDASYMDDPALKARGGELIKTYGCAGCHEIRGFEEEQRIGKELTTEGATPLERLDFALMTHEAEDGHDPLNLREDRKDERWYNHKGFFERKIEDPSIYDRGKEKEPQDHLRMPDPFMKDDWRAALTTFLLGSKGDEGSNVPKSFYYTPNSLQKDVQDGWWVIKKYNCMGCHQIQVGQERPALTRLPWYEEAGELGKRQWPPGLLTEGARVDPNWLLRFLRDPSLSGLSEEELTATAHGTGAGGTRAGGRATGAGGAGAAGGATTARPSASPTASTAQLQPAPPASGQPSQAGAAAGPVAALPPQPGENINGLRRNLAPRMPTFNFSPNELRILVRFFMAYSSQQEPYIKEHIAPLTPEETSVARAFFSSGTQPCLSCHLTGDPTHDQTAYAPNFLDAAQRLKPAWTLRWILDPPKIWPDTTMPGGLFAWQDGRWVPTAGMSAEAASYQGDHANLIMRYILQMTEAEQNTLAALGRAAQSRPATAAPPAAPPPVAAAHGRQKNTPTAAVRRPAGERRAARAATARRGGKTQVSRARTPARARLRASGVAALRNAGRGGFSP